VHSARHLTGAAHDWQTAYIARSARRAVDARRKAAAPGSACNASSSSRWQRATLAPAGSGGGGGGTHGAGRWEATAWAPLAAGRWRTSQGGGGAHTAAGRRQCTACNACWAQVSGALRLANRARCEGGATHRRWQPMQRARHLKRATQDGREAVGGHCFGAARSRRLQKLTGGAQTRRGNAGSVRRATHARQEEAAGHGRRLMCSVLQRRQLYLEQAHQPLQRVAILGCMRLAPHPSGNHAPSTHRSSSRERLPQTTTRRLDRIGARSLNACDIPKRQSVVN
jgi:hypothetical protein